MNRHGGDEPRPPRPSRWGRKVCCRVWCRFRFVATDAESRLWQRPALMNLNRLDTEGIRHLQHQVIRDNGHENLT